MKWFFYQEVAGEAGFEDLLAMTQVRMSGQAKLEIARNYWDEMGRGTARACTGECSRTLRTTFNITPTADTVVPEALALGNAMIAMARHGHYAFHSIGALGVIEIRS